MRSRFLLCTDSSLTMFADFLFLLQSLPSRLPPPRFILNLSFTTLVPVLAPPMPTPTPEEVRSALLRFCFFPSFRWSFAFFSLCPSSIPISRFRRWRASRSMVVRSQGDDIESRRFVPSLSLSSLSSSHSSRLLYFHTYSKPCHPPTPSPLPHSASPSPLNRLHRSVYPHLGGRSPLYGRYSVSRRRIEGLQGHAQHCWRREGVQAHREEGGRRALRRPHREGNGSCRRRRVARSLRDGRQVRQCPCQDGREGSSLVRLFSPSLFPFLSPFSIAYPAFAGNSATRCPAMPLGASSRTR